MAADRNQHNSTSDDLSQGIKTGAKAAKSARNMAKAAGKAATGNYVGAAKDVLTDEGFRRFLVALLIFQFFLMFCCLYLAPMALYETLSGYLKALKEDWAIQYYSGNSGRFVSFLKATAGVISDRFSAAWDKIRGTRVDEDDHDIPQDSDLGVLGSKSDLTETYTRKIQACVDKVLARQDSLYQLITTGQVMSGSSKVSDIMYSKYLSEFSHKYDGIEYWETVYDGFSWAKMSSSVSSRDALMLLCLHTVQKDISLKDVELSGFIKWLGYNGGGGRRIEFQLGDNEQIWYQVPAWKGGFKPQYLMDEEKQRKNANYSDKECAVVDLLLKIDCPNIYSIAGSEREEIIQDQIEVDDLTKPIRSGGQDYTRYRRGEQPDDFYRTWWKNGWRFVRNAWCEGQFGNWLYLRSGWTFGINASGQAELFRKESNPMPVGEIIGYEKKLVDIERHVFHVTYVVPVAISCRSASEMVELAGLWEGFLPDILEALGRGDQKNNAEIIDMAS